MKKVWKWVIGIAIVLVVAAALVGGAFLMRSHFVNAVAVARPGLQVPGNGKLPFNQVQPGLRGRGMMRFGNDGWGGGGRVMHGPGMMGFGRGMPFGGFFRGLFCLGFLALVVLGIIWLVRRLRKPAAVVVAPVAPAGDVAPVAAPVAQVAPVAPLAAVHPCAKCGEPVQDGWKHCPNCGKKQ
jgi:hypothetical protein